MSTDSFSSHRSRSPNGSSSSDGSASMMSNESAPNASPSDSAPNTGSAPDGHAPARASFLDGQLQETELLRRLTAAAGEALMLKDRVGRYRFVNDAVCEIVGLGREEVLGRSDAELFGPDVGEDLRQQEMQVFATGEPVRYQETLPLDAAGNGSPQGASPTGSPGDGSPGNGSPTNGSPSNGQPSNGQASSDAAPSSGGSPGAGPAHVFQVEC